MKTLEIQVPDPLAEKLKGLVDAGWFASEDEIGRLALSEFLSCQRFKLQERFQREDISWALRQKGGVD
jgi:Arc/MetJ-type ribon-helix-helix transcriptional regulator